MKSEISLVLLILVLIAPYLLLFYKKVGLRIRLLFASMGAISILCTLIAIDFFSNGVLSEMIFFYSQFVWVSVFLNFVLIFLSWLIKKTKPNIKKT